MDCMPVTVRDPGSAWSHIASAIWSVPTCWKMVRRQLRTIFYAVQSAVSEPTSALPEYRNNQELANRSVILQKFETISCFRWKGRDEKAPECA
jgi:hypothetical protein